MLFTDIVGSTERAAALGDRAWRDLLRRHHRLVRRQLRAHRGREIDTAGDGFFVTFGGPDEAIACALAIADGLTALGIEIRAAIHTGEVEPIGNKVGGIAVHLGARILGAAEPGQIVVSGTVRDLASGSGYAFTDLGTRQLKGMTEASHLFAVVRPAPSAELVQQPDESSEGGRRVRLAVIAGVVVLFAALGGAAIVVLTMGTGATGVADGPNVVRAIDASSRLGAGFDVGRGPSALIVDGAAVWVANTEGGTISRVDPREGQTAVVGVGVPVDLTANGGLIWVLDPFANSLSIVSPSEARVIGSLEVHGRAMAATADAIWLADDLTATVHRIDTRSRREVATVELAPGSQPTAIAGDESGVWVANGGTSTISRIDPTTNEVTVDAIGVSEPPTSLAIADGRVWVLLESADLLVRIDAASNRVGEEMEVCDRPSGLAASGDRVWIACAGDGSVWRIEAGSAEAVATDVGGVPSDIAIDGETAWVTIRES